MKSIEKIKICRLRSVDIKEFKKFIKRHWNKNHIFANNSSFFNWQHRVKSNYNCVVAKKNKKILGVQAFITQTHYDSKLPKNQIFLTLFRCLEDSKPGIGLKIYKTVVKKYNPEFIGTTGFDSKLISFHKWQGYKIGLMNHYVALSSIKKNFIIAKIPKKFKKYMTKKNVFCNYKKLDLNDIDKLTDSKLYTYQIPTKSNAFIKNRFMKHPVYKYLVYAAIKNNKAVALCVLRIIKKSRNTVIKLVDFIGQGKFFTLFNSLFITLLKKYSAEYIDFYSFGIKLDYIKKAGFINVKKYKDLIIPEYFEPFVRSNIDLMYGYKTSVKYPPVRIFKADGDRDRPSL